MNPVKFRMQVLTCLPRAVVPMLVFFPKALQRSSGPPTMYTIGGQLGGGLHCSSVLKSFALLHWVSFIHPQPRDDPKAPYADLKEPILKFPPLCDCPEKELFLPALWLGSQGFSYHTLTMIRSILGWNSKRKERGKWVLPLTYILQTLEAPFPSSSDQRDWFFSGF